MIACLNNGLFELLTQYEWQELTVTAELSVVAAAEGDVDSAFDLPADFFRFIDQTQWNSQSLIPSMGPISPQAWMMYTVLDFTPQLTFFWQLRGGKLHVMNAPYPTPGTFKYMYLSNALVLDENGTTYKNTASSNGDTFLLDSNLVMLMGRVKYLESKGFDTGAATRDFLRAMEGVSSKDKGATTLSMNRSSGVPLINARTSVPVTGYGS
jgi:hypothetical protein